MVWAEGTVRSEAAGPHGTQLSAGGTGGTCSLHTGNRRVESQSLTTSKAGTICCLSGVRGGMQGADTVS